METCEVLHHSDIEWPRTRGSCARTHFSIGESAYLKSTTVGGMCQFGLVGRTNAVRKRLSLL